MQLKLASLVLASTMLSGCGTILTLANQDGVAYGLKRTHCDHLPYVYSGVAYNVCRLNGDAVTDSEGAPVAGHSGEFIEVGADLVLSGVADTVALPYTLVQQAHGDHIRIRR